MINEQMRYARLANITKIINTKLELHEVLQHVTTAISEEIVQCNSVGIYLPEKDGTFRGFAGKPEVINGITLDTQIINPENDLLAKEVIETRKTIYISDTSKDNRPDPRSVEAFEIKSLLVLPISFEKELFGLVFLFDYGIPMNLTTSEIQTVEAYVNMAAVAIQNAKNLVQKENLIAEKQLLLNITSDLSMCSSTQGSLDTCFFYLDKTLGSKNMAAHLLEQAGNEIIKETLLCKGNDWTEIEWIENLTNDAVDQTYKTMMQKVIETKEAIHNESMLMTPLVSMGEVLGVIVIVNIDLQDGHDYENKMQLTKSIVDATASTFSNLLYMEQLENTVEKRTKELATANDKVTSIIESMTDGFFTLNKKWEFTYINKHQSLPQSETLVDVLGKNIWDIYPSSVNTNIYKELHRAMFQRVPVQCEITPTSDDYWQEVIAYPFEDGICCLIKNITEKKKYEKELRRLSNIELIGQMAAGISHEIRNPMTTVRGFLQLLTNDNQFESHNHYFKLMIEELDRANAIITEFLSIGNTKTSKLQLLDLNSIIKDITPIIEIETYNQKKFLEVNLNDIPDLLLNHNEIRQLLVNLYRNGLEAMDTGKVLSISTYKENENYVVLSVRDQGKGIPPEIMEKIGTPFYTTKDSGTGLGLGICYAIAARHNAKIEIQSGLEGTSFLVKFKY